MYKFSRPSLCILIPGILSVASIAIAEEPIPAEVPFATIQGKIHDGGPSPARIDTQPAFETISARIFPTDSPGSDIYFMPRRPDDQVGDADETCVPCQPTVVTFDPITRTVTRTVLPPEGYSSQGPHVLPAGKGDPSYVGEDLSALKDFSALDPPAMVLNTTVGDYPKHVRIRSWYYDENGISRGSFSCSGTMIDPMHVLTAGHCVYAWDDDNGNDIEDWVYRLEVRPAENAGALPFGIVGYTNIHSFDGWTENEDYDWDIAVIDLDRPIGALTGWRGVGSNSDCDFFDDNSWIRNSYPGEDFAGNVMYTQSGNYDNCEATGSSWFGNEVSYDRVAIKGQSGSGGIKNGVAWTVASNIYCDPGCTSFDVRITPTMFDNIAWWMFGDTAQSLDLWAMDTRADPSVLAGAELDSLNFLVLNYSNTAVNETRSFEVYLSSDDQITQSDIFVVGGSFTANLPAQGSARVNIIPPTIPATVSNGEYFLGVILLTPDANPGNNDSSGIEATQITVSCDIGSAPSHAAPSQGAQCMPLNLTFDWSDEGVGADYQLQVSSACQAGPIYETSSSQHTVYGLTPNTTYFWRVRAKLACGNWGSWSSCWAIRTEGPVAPVTGIQAPYDGATCLPTDLLLDWSSSPEAVSYQVDLGTQCPAGIYSTVIGSAFAATNLQPGTEYFWRVRAKNQCGDFSAWSACRRFTTDYETVPSPNIIQPQDAISCISGDVVIVWETVPGATDYDVAFGQPDCNALVESNVVGNSKNFLGLASGSYFWRIRANACGRIGEWSPCYWFIVDGEAPILPQDPWSPTHTVGQWSTSNAITLNWEAASDACSVDGYQTMFDEMPASIPDYNHDTTDNFITSDPLEDGQNHYFHLMASDFPGNQSPPRHAGPFWIDATAPTNPADFSADQIPGQWGSYNQITASWSGAVDTPTGSGVAGYSILWNHKLNGNLDDIIDTQGGSSVLSPVSEGNHYFHLKTLDVAGNVSPTVHLGPFLVDRTVPEVQVLSPNGGVDLVHGTETTITWSHDDASSGIAQVALSYSVDGGSTYREIATLDESTGKIAGEYGWAIPFAPSANVWIRVEVMDYAGNVSEDLSDYPCSIVTGAVDAPPSRDDVLAFSLDPALPNPFNPMTTLHYAVPHSAHVVLRVYDSAGRMVRTLVNGPQLGPSQHQVRWNGTDDRGLSVASGVYFYRMEAEGFAETRRMTLIK